MSAVPTINLNDPQHPHQTEARRRLWIARVEALINETEKWAATHRWATARTEKNINERQLGAYSVPSLRVRLLNGEVHVIPVAQQVMGADGRIDIEAFPALNRVKLIARDDQWIIYTDSNIPLRQPWNAETFAQLAQDLTA
jgi:hypothetical protein